MKYKSSIIKSLVAFSIIVAFTSCDKQLDDLRDNPNAVTDIDDAALFTKATRELFLGTSGVSAVSFAGHYGHYFVAGSTARFPDQYGDNFDLQYNQMFTGMYGGPIKHIEEALFLTLEGERENEVRHAIAQIIAVLGYAKLTDAFGDIPYTEGGKGKTGDIITPKYDSQSEIYKDLIARLGNSIKVLKTANPERGYGPSDFVFGNDMDKWARFANSVRLRLAMRLRYVDISFSEQTVAQCLNEPLMEENGHNVTMVQTEGNGNPWFISRTGFPSIKMSTMLIDQLQSTDDPRLPVFVTPDGNGQFSGMTNGLTDVAFGNSDFANKSDIGISLSLPESELYLMTASEVWLLRAEAALVYDNDLGTATTLYRKGIETSLQQWNISSDLITTFLASPIASLSAGDGELKIGTQMWLALIPDYFEGWSHVRRTGYPEIEQRTADNLDKGVTNGVLPTRFLYSTFELSSNKTNVEEAIARQGANAIDTPVWWDKN
ncbi:SusD/RagB family nutrient-binding outer membrane lipoprotein [Flagellimonas onchidii]|uniref:SusD/RagB family nutrient-binding outer membrane lipoprotein n=1 Tax=Flagellimonas onchidii TaxID=2562684 RepID=UPI0010A5CF6E|nr:SusD/RagB family nutrient-binding outer membrane lipoprotein [Allomuricauda onchidii]